MGLSFNRAETRSRRNCDNTPDAAWVPIASNPQVVGGTRDGHGCEQHEWRGHVRERGAVERARDDTGKQDGLREDEQGSHDPEQGIGSERDAGGARAAEEARVERSHVSESTAGGLRGSGRPRRASGFAARRSIGFATGSTWPSRACPRFGAHVLSSADTMSGTDSNTSSAESAGDSPAPAARKPRLSGIPLLIAAIAVVLFVQARSCSRTSARFTHPKPHKVAFGVVGASPLPVAVGKQFSLKTTVYASESAALAAIDERKIDGAFVAGPAGRS